MNSLFGDEQRKKDSAFTVTLSAECEQERKLVLQGLKETGCVDEEFRAWAEQQGYTPESVLDAVWPTMNSWTTRHGRLTVEKVLINSRPMIESCIYTPADVDDQRRWTRPRPDRIGDFIRMKDGSLLKDRPPWPGAVILMGHGVPTHLGQYRMEDLELISDALAHWNLHSTDERIFLICLHLGGGSAPPTITPDLHLDDDLVLDRYELLLDIEDVFFKGRSMPLDALDECVYVRDVIDYVNNRPIEVIMEELASMIDVSGEDVRVDLKDVIEYVESRPEDIMELFGFEMTWDDEDANSYFFDLYEYVKGKSKEEE